MVIENVYQCMNCRSAFFRFSDLGKVYVKLTDVARGNEILVKIFVTIEEATIFIMLSEEDKLWPFRIDNMTQTDVIVKQNVNIRNDVLRNFLEYKNAISSEKWQVNGVYVG